ncbi:uromodulin-like [Discoglossus pictus]
MIMDIRSISLLVLFLGGTASDWYYPSSTYEPFTSYFTETLTTNAFTIVGDTSCASVTEFPSVSFVVDTTGSMYYALETVKEASRVLLQRLSEQTHGYVRQYSVMEFNDPSVGPLYVTCSMTDFGSYINNIYAYDGGDCPELAMAGLLRTLENIPYGSLIVLTTDASAKDYYDQSLLNQINYLLDAKQAKVIFLITGYCSGVNDPDFQVYKNIATQSYGHVFQNFISASGINELGIFLNFLLWKPVNSSIRLFSYDGTWGDYTFNFTVPVGLSSLIISTDGLINSLNPVEPSGNNATIKSLVSQAWGSLFLVENPSSGIWTIHLNAGDYYSVRIEGFTASELSSKNISAVDICSKCDPNAECEEYLNFQACFCKDGFQGDGYSCYDIDECSDYYGNRCYPHMCINTYGSYTCQCNYGYELSSDNTCVDIDECSRPDLNYCDVHATCYNYVSGYYCECSAGYTGNGYYCEFDECTTDVCLFGTECVKTTGSYYCMDPCVNNTVLDQPWRSMSYVDYYYYYHYCYYYGYCDNNLNGWYRFTGSGGSRMADTCPASYSCRSEYPMWLNGPHPKPVDGIVDRTVCVNYYSNCCYWSTAVQVKACSEGYHVYKIQSTPVWSATYCTDPTTSIESCACTADEECRLVDGHYGCYCKDMYDLSVIENLRPNLTCGNQEIRASFKKCQLKYLNLNTEKIHLTDSRCIGVPDYNDTTTISVISLLKAGVCGNEFIKSGNNVIYRNTIYLSLNANSSSSGEDVATITYSCVYPLDMQITLETTLNPFVSAINITMEGQGQFVVRIALYQDNSYLTPYTGGQVILTSTTMLYIGTILEGGDTSQFNLVMKNCYVTPTKDPSDTTKYYIIRDSCPSRQDYTISVSENGVSRNGRLSVQLFSYVKGLSSVYLHCEVHVCDVKSEICKPSCTGLTSRSNTPTQVISLGPIIKQADTTSLSASGTRNLIALQAAILFLAGHLLFMFFI